MIDFRFLPSSLSGAMSQAADPAVLARIDGPLAPEGSTMAPYCTAGSNLLACRRGEQWKPCHDVHSPPASRHGWRHSARLLATAFHLDGIRP